MKILGKCPPEPEELEKTAENGFDYAELYLEKNHLDNLEETIKNVKNADIEVETAHTSHVDLDEIEYFEKADELVNRIDAYLVVHSQFLHHTHILKIEEQVKFTVDYGYENNPGISKKAIKNMILDRGFDLVLDTAHYFIGEENFQEEFGNLLNNHTEQIKVVHLCDSSFIIDGLAFGEGDMDIEETVKTLTNSDFDGYVVLEVMPEHQKDALEKFNDYKN